MNPSRASDVFGLLEAAAREHPAHVASRSLRGGTWEWTTWEELLGVARALALALVDRGIERGASIALMASTREEWTAMDFAIVAAGGVTVPIYPTATAEQVEHLLRDSAAVLAVVEGPPQLAAVEAALRAAPLLNEVVVLEAGFGRDTDAGGESTVPVTPYAELVRRGRERIETEGGRADLDARRGSTSPDDLATLVYTSGTTGPPRGVMLTHRALLSETLALLDAFSLALDDEQLLLLPLAHIFAKILVLVHVASRTRLAYASGPHRFARDLAEIEPTFFATVPRFLEKVYAVANDSARAGGPLKAALWDWAVDVGKQKTDRHARGLAPRRLLSAQARYADKLVLARVRAAFGKRLRFVISGAAPLSLELAEWLLACGVTVLEGYGLTEIGGASHVNRPGRFRLGTVGQPLPGYAAKLAADGEVLLRGPSAMKGYRSNTEATALALDGDGWLHTGDVGKIDDEGYLSIVDRKKDVIVTAGGSNVAPGNIERLLLASPWLSQAVVIGDLRPYLVALLTLEEAVCRRWAEEKGRPSELHRLAQDLELRALIQLDVDRANERLASFETIKRFAVLPRRFSTEHGELTDLGKLRRAAIRGLYADVVETLYA